jgi:1-deoxy-D-xylulose-5-phosphate synthase
MFADQGISAHVRRLGIPDEFVEHGDVKTLYNQCGYDEQGIITAGQDLLSLE